MNFFTRFIERAFLVATIISASFSIFILGFMVILGLPLLKGGHFFSLLTDSWNPYHGTYGIYPMIIGTLSIATLSLIIALPLSLGCSSFICVIGPKSLSYALKKIVHFMTGIPTVIYGFLGVFLLVPIIRELFEQGSGMCILSASILLAVLISPTMILFFSDSFDRVPKSFLNAVDAIGGTKVQKFIYVVIPCSWKGIFTGIALGLGRAMGDTLISLMIAGNAVLIPTSVLDSSRTLTAHIALIIAADFNSLEFKTLFICGIILYVFTTLIVFFIRFMELISVKKYNND